MIIEVIIKSLRKLGFFLTTTFPILSRLTERIGRVLGFLITNPVVAPIWNRIISSPRGQAFLNVIQRFWWRDYSKQRINADDLPPEGMAILRPVMLLAAALCILMPLAMTVPWPAVPAAKVAEAQGPIAAWSILLWLLTLSLAWSSLIVGAGASNRISFIVVTVLFIHFTVYATFSSLPASFWNLPLLLVVIISLAFLEGRLKGTTAYGRAMGLITCMLAGTGAGYFFAGRLPLPHKGFLLRLLIGACMGLLALAWARTSGEGRILRWLPPPAGSAALTFRNLAGLLLIFYLSLAVRGGLAVPATSTVEFISLFSSYLWPVWYLVGTGLIFKLLNHTKILTHSIRDLIPGRWLAPVVTLIFLAGTLITWSEAVLNTLGLPWPQPLVTLMSRIYFYTQGVIWSSPFYALCAGAMRWVLLFYLIAALWLALRRRLTTAIALVLLFHTILLWFMINQYYLKFFSFAEGYATSPLIMLLLALMVLWLLYRIGLTMTLDSSPHWPSVGRVAIFSAILLFVLLEIHCRAALHDALAMNKIFLYTFRGIIDFGLPYFLLIYASRRLKELPVTILHLIGAFSVGAVIALLLNICDKLIAARGSLTALQAYLDTRFEAILNNQTELLKAMVPILPPTWIFIRGLLAMGALLLIAMFLRRRLRHRSTGAASLIFLIVASASGMAGFSQIRLDIPIVSPVWAQMILPYQWSMEIDANIIALYMAFTIPALVLGWLITRPGGITISRWLGASIVATSLHIAACFLWPGQEAWLRSSGMIFTCGAAGVGLFVLLIRNVRLRIESEMDQTTQGEASEHKTILRSRMFTTLIAAGGLALGVVAFYQFQTGRLIQRNIQGLPCPLSLPAAWSQLKQAPQQNVRAVFSRSTVSGGNPLIIIEVRNRPEGGTQALMETTVKDAAQDLPDFKISRGPQMWDHYLANALALDFFFSKPLADNRSEPMLATISLLPISEGDVLALALVTNPIDFKVRRWDLILAAEALRDRR